MPFPAARDSLPYVGSSRGNGPGTIACADQEIGSVIRSRQSAQRAIDHTVFAQVRCRDVWRFLAEAHSSLPCRPSNRRDPGQRSISPCNATPAIPGSSPAETVIVISSPLQSGLESSRKSLEAGSKAVHSQQILSGAPRSGCRRINPDGFLENTQQRTLQIMRHYLSRSV